MSDKLSQEQIDALLSQISEGKVVDESTEIGDFGRFHPYDFHKPEKFGAEHLESLKTIASAFNEKKYGVCFPAYPDSNSYRSNPCRSSFFCEWLYRNNAER